MVQFTPCARVVGQMRASGSVPVRPAQPRAAPLEMPNHTTANKTEVVRSEVEQAATSASPCASEQQLSPSAKLPEHEVAVGYDGDDDEQMSSSSYPRIKAVRLVR